MLEKNLVFSQKIQIGNYKVMNKYYAKFIELAMQKSAKNPADFSRVKKDICKEIGIQPPTNADIREIYEKMVSRKKIRRNFNFENQLFSKKIRTESGVAVIAVLTKPYPCPGKCLYCPSEKDMPKSYLSNEPAVMRAINAKFNPYNQVTRRIRALELNGHKTDKIELIVMGGTFSYLPKSYQERFIAECFSACNDYGKKIKSQKLKVKNKRILSKEQKRNENAKHRIIGLTLETRPDYIDEKEILNFRKLGCTRVELGVQSIFDDVLKINKRGHSVFETIKATKLLKDTGFKINYHIMPGLLGSNVKKDYRMFKELFSNSDFQPDMLKIYPTVVVKKSALYRLWKNGKYKPLNDKEFTKFILKVKKEIIPPYVRIARLVRDVPTTSIIAGPKISNLRQNIKPESFCQCIRCREIRSKYNAKEKIIFNRIDYTASDGQEIFLQYVSKDKRKLFALLRLRIPKVEPSLKRRFNLRTSMIREVHTYGKLKSLNNKSLPASLHEALQVGPQHIGLGRKLIEEAEKISKKEFSLKKISVISGIGARNYYRKLGYKLKNSYMVKDI